MSNWKMWGVVGVRSMRFKGAKEIGVESDFIRKWLSRTRMRIDATKAYGSYVEATPHSARLMKPV